MAAFFVACALCIPIADSAAAATADAAVFSVTAPVTALGTQVWVDVDSPSGDSGHLTGEIRNNSDWVALPLRETVFGMGAIASVQPGTVEVRLRSSTGSNPDLALTVVDAQGVILNESRARLVLTSAASFPPTQTDPHVDPATDSTLSSSITSEAAQLLANVGISPLGALLLGVATLGAGLVTIAARRRLRGN